MSSKNLLMKSWVLAVVLLLSSMAFGQRAEAFGGYQYFRLNTGVSGVDSINLNGWNASLSGFFNDYLGATADFSGAYGSPFSVSTKVHTFMFGPTVRLHNPSPLVPFAHVLFGGARLSANAGGLSGSSTNFAWAAGGGVDLKFAPAVSFRLGQIDYLQVRDSGDSVNNFRYSAGLVLRF
jgi:opacity protein-like surface antigen